MGLPYAWLAASSWLQWKWRARSNTGLERKRNKMDLKESIKSTAAIIESLDLHLNYRDSIADVEEAAARFAPPSSFMDELHRTAEAINAAISPGLEATLKAAESYRETCASV